MKKLLLIFLSFACIAAHAQYRLLTTLKDSVDIANKINLNSTAIQAVRDLQRHHQFVNETTPRRKGAKWIYTGTVRNVPGTYATITAAINAAVSGDIIQLSDGTYFTKAESGGFLLINSSTKRLLIRGNPTNRSAVTLVEDSAAGYCVRIRTSSQVTFQNLTITTNQNNPTVFTNDNTASSPVSVMFDSCVIKNTSATTIQTVSFSGTSTNVNYFEFKNTDIYSNGNTSYPAISFSIPTILSDANYAAFPQTVMITGGHIYGWQDWGDQAFNLYEYDVQCIQNVSGTGKVFAFGQDGGTPTVSSAYIDIRGCRFAYSTNTGHAVLLGRGTRRILFLNNTLYCPPATSGVALGLVIKSTPVVPDSVIIEGNNITAPRAIYIKGGKNNTIKFNTAISNWSDTTGGFGLVINNPVESDGAISSPGNIITYNRIIGKLAAIDLYTESGAPIVKNSVDSCVIDYNYYSATLNDTAYIAVQDIVNKGWKAASSFWTTAHDKGSSFITYVNPQQVLTTDDFLQKVQVNGQVEATQFKLSANNTAPLSATDTGTVGEIRITNGFLYYCPVTNTWLRVALTTW